jgi:hypothetical protein
MFVQEQSKYLKSRCSKSISRVHSFYEKGPSYSYLKIYHFLLVYSFDFQSKPAIGLFIEVILKVTCSLCKQLASIYSHGYLIFHGPTDQISICFLAKGH